MKLFSSKKRKRPNDSLPIIAYKEDLLDAIAKHPVVLVTAATGSGKSTLLPPLLLGRYGKMVVTQPRRVAAMTLARRVAQSHYYSNNNKKAIVAHCVRFDDTTTSYTQLVYATDGMLLRQAMVDPLLKQYGLIFLDEAHERSLATDLLLGLVKRALNVRPSLKVVIMSATLEVQTMADFFGSSVKQVNVPGRQHPVETLYLNEATNDYLEACLSTLLNIHQYEEQGDVLVFLPGQEEIQDLTSLLRQNLVEQDSIRWTGDHVIDLKDEAVNSNIVNGVWICPLYAALPPEAQLAAFEAKPANCSRKIILATNIAETSVTLPDIKFVVDPGKHKQRHVTNGMDCLQVETISRAQASQRTGRAGRVGPGTCFRLYTEDAFDSLNETSPPEIQRVHLGQVVLQLKQMRLDPTSFDFVNPPSKTSLMRATRLLYALGCLDDGMQLTSHGRLLASWPLDPIAGHLLAQSAKDKCRYEMLTAVAVMSTEHLFVKHEKAAQAHRRFASYEGDLPTYVNVYSAWHKEVKNDKDKRSHAEWCRRNYISGRALVRAHHVRQQLAALCKDDSLPNEDPLAFLRCVAAGLFLQAAKRTNTDDNKQRGRYQTTVGGTTVAIHPASTLFGRNPAPACVVYTEMVTTTKTYIRGVTQIRPEWLQEMAPSFYKK